MIDLHCHILPGVDDGSKSIEQSINIAKEAENAGFDTIYCTPHYMVPNYTSSRKKNLEIIKDLQEILKQNNINIKLELSNEVYINEEIVELLNNNIISKINNTNYLLMELPMHQEIKYIDEILDEIQDANIKIILAHPERYKFIQDDPNKAINFLERGIILQSNYASLIGKYGPNAKKTLTKMLKANMISILSSDVHRDNSIYTYMKDILPKLKKIVDKEYYNLLTEVNPKKVAENEEIENLNYKKVKKFFL